MGRRGRRDKKPKTATQLQKDIEALDFRLETEALKFSEEKKIRATIRELKKEKASYLARIKKVVDSRISKSGVSRGRISVTKEVPSEELVSDYSTRIKNARLAKQQTHAEFASFLNEKESVVAKWESGNLRPSLETAKTLEKKLKITLVVEGGVDTADAGDIIKSLTPVKGTKNATLGDLVKVKVRNR